MAQISMPVSSRLYHFAREIDALPASEHATKLVREASEILEIVFEMEGRLWRTRITGGASDVLSQLCTGPKWDGDIASKDARDNLAEWGLVERYEGFNFLTKSGIQIAILFGRLKY